MHYQLKAKQDFGSHPQSRPIVNGFELVGLKEVPFLGLIAHQFRSLQTGMEVMLMETADENMSFQISFRTPNPNSSNGLKHILEHMRFRGTENYPLKNLDSAISNTSHASVHNASTGPESTEYYFITSQPADFRNMLKVYLDISFKPLLTYESFLAEAWHYEIRQTSNGEMLFTNGRVLNEMRGRHDSPRNQIQHAIRQSLYPEFTDGFSSGGLPSEITRLSYEEVIEYNSHHYLPGNSKIVVSFNPKKIEIGEILAEISSATVDFTCLHYDTSIKVQPNIPAQYSEIEIVSGNPQVGMGWLLPEDLAPEDRLSLRLISSLISDWLHSPVCLALASANLAQGSTDTSVLGIKKQDIFSIHFQSDCSKKLGNIPIVVFREMEKLSKNGFDPDLLKAVFVSCEQMLHAARVSEDRGLGIGQQVLGLWHNDRDPMIAFEMDKIFSFLKQKHETGQKIFEEVMKKCLVTNNHKAIVYADIDRSQGEYIRTKERQELDSIYESLSENDKEAIKLNKSALLAYIESEDNEDELSKFPRVEVHDLNRKEVQFEMQKYQIAGFNLDIRQTFCADRAHIHLSSEVNLDLDGEDVILADTALTARNSIKRFRTQEERQQLFEGQGEHSISVYPQANSRYEKDCSVRMLLSAHSNVTSFPGLLDKACQSIGSFKFEDVKLIIPHLVNERAEFFNGIHENLLREIIIRSTSSLSTINCARNSSLSYIERVRFIDRLLNQADDNINKLADRIENVLAKLTFGADRVGHLVVDSHQLSTVLPVLEKSLHKLPKNMYQAKSAQPLDIVLPQNEAFLVPGRTNYTAMAGMLIPGEAKLGGRVEVVSNLLNSQYIDLHLKHKGHAYSSTFNMNGQQGSYFFVSGQDPHIVRSLNVYRDAGRFLSSGNITQSAINDSIVRSIAELDKPQDPQSRSRQHISHMTTGVTYEMEQAWRDQIFNTRLEDIRKIGEALEASYETARIVVYSNAKDLAEAANEAQAERLGIREAFLNPRQLLS